MDQCAICHLRPGLAKTLHRAAGRDHTTRALEPDLDQLRPVVRRLKTHGRLPAAMAASATVAAEATRAKKAEHRAVRAVDEAALAARVR